MADMREKLASSLQALKDYQDASGVAVLKGKAALGTTHTDRLLQNGFLEQITKGWYMPTHPGQEGDSAVWYACFWDFVVAYCNDKFGDEWCLTPEESLALHSGNYLVPAQLVVRSPRASNNVLPLKYGTSMLCIAASVARQTVVEQQHRIRIYGMAEALVYASPGFFVADKIHARTCLAGIQSAADILRIVTEEGNSVRAGRMAGALRNIGRDEMADEIMRMMTRLGYDVRLNDPFEEKTEVPVSSSPHATRIRLAWAEMRKQIMGLELRPPYVAYRSASDILDDMDEQYVHDAYHSLSIEGYRVTEGLVERVRSGRWNPQEDQTDADRRNALAARGYYQAFQSVRGSVERILNGANPGDVFAADHDNWHFELFEPCVQAGIIAPSDLIGYRTHPVYIRGSKHVPLNADAVRPAMLTLCDLLRTEDDAFVRALLGHFFLVFIHPYMDGNGRTARFLLNVMLTTSGLPWTIVPMERRGDYMSALETASTMGDIVPFARFIHSLIAQK